MYAGGKTSALLCVLSLIASVPFRLPDAVGVNVMLKAQLELEAKVGSQLLVWAKSPVVQSGGSTC